MSEQPGRYQRSPNALVGSMLVVLVVVAAFVAIRSFARGNQDVAAPTVDYAAAAKQARSEGRLVVAAPHPMPKGWRATSARYSGASSPTWHVGILTRAKTYVAIEEAQRPQGEMVAKQLARGARRVGTKTAGGETWSAWKAAKGFALTRTIGQETLYVGGPAGEQATLELAGTLDQAQVRTAG